VGLANQRVKPTNDLQSQALQVLDRAGAISLDYDTSAVIYNCDPQANHRAIVRVNEFCRLHLLKGTREDEHLRDRCFATTRFRCTKIRYTGAVCGSPGSVEIEPSVLLPVAGEDTLAFLSCGTCLPS
jgi:hypothetical protein